MAEKRLSELDAITTVQNTDLVELAQDNGLGGFVSKKITFGDLKSSIKTTSAITFTIGDGGSQIDVGTKGYIGSIPFNATIKSWRLFEVSATPVSGSIVIDIWKDVAGNYPPTVVNSIAGTEKPMLSNQTNNSDTNLTTWMTLSISSGDVVGFNVESNSGCKKVILILEVEK